MAVPRSVLETDRGTFLSSKGNLSSGGIDMNKLTVKDLDVKGKRVFVRVDFNVPMDENQNITDDKRIRAALPTIQYLIDQGARVILASHLGRPKDQPEDKFRMDPVAKRLAELLGKEVTKVDDCIGRSGTTVAGLKDGTCASGKCPVLPVKRKTIRVARTWQATRFTSMMP